jgi:hypothetical protein
MKITRFVTAEVPGGGVHVQVDEVVPDTNTVASPAMVLWGWDAMPALPIAPDALGPEHTDRALFPPPGGATVNLVVFPPAGGQMTASEDATEGLETDDDAESAMHRTDTIDFLFILEGEVVLKHPGCDDITLRRGDVFVQNGAMHEWQNRMPEPCVMACVVLATPRAD